MKREVSVLLAGFALAGTAFGAWQSFGSGWGSPQGPRITIVEQSGTRTVFEVELSGIEVTPMAVEGEEFVHFSLPGEVMAVLEEGKPEVPKVSVLLAIPSRAQVSTRVLERETRTLEVRNVLPLQPPLLDGQEPGPLVIDRTFYSQDQSYPVDDVKVIETGVWRDLDVANIQVYPVKVNPAQGRAEVAVRTRVEVHYSGGTYEKRIADWMVPTYGRFVDNFQAVGFRPETDYTAGVRYLVFCHDNWSTNTWLVDSLLGWVVKRGYEVRMITGSSFTAAQIKDSIRSEYNRNNPHLLRWVLLVGEGDNPTPEIPTGSYGGVGYSDFYYSDLEPWPGGDNYPEVGIARLSPSSAGDLENQIRKILKYQKNPVATNNWLTQLTMVANYEDYPGKYSGCVRGIYNMPMPYYHPVVDTIMGQYETSNTPITNAVNAGVGILPYRGHGNTTIWAAWTANGVSWANANIQSLSNGDMTPVVYNVACCNGEIFNATCLSEQWLRKYPGGAAASLGATQASYTYPNHGICSTLVRATTDTWTITVPGVRNYPGPVFDVAGIMQYMDAYVAKYWPTSPYPYNIWMYLFLGDPSMPVWSGGMPQVPTVNHPATIPFGPSVLNVTVQVGGRPVEGALVCAWKGVEFYVAERTNAAGLAQLAVNAASAGTVLITVSEGHAEHSVPGVQHTPIIPYEGTATVQQTLDVGVTQLIAPPAVVDSGTTVTPQARVKNFGTTAADFQVIYWIGSFYADTQDVSSLAPGDSQLVNFLNWTATQRGTHATRCSTDFVGDGNPNNNQLTGSVTVRVLDAAVLRIVGPSGTIDSGTVVTPQAWVINYGSPAATFQAIFRIGSFYADPQNVSNLAPGDSQLVSFANWTANQRGTHVTQCSTALVGDVIPDNNSVAGTVTVRVHDVAPVQIVAPTGFVGLGSVIAPEAKVKNLGTELASFTVTFKIGAGYTDTQNVANLAAGDSLNVTFANWTATPGGTYATRCSTAMAGDLRPGNDTINGTVRVALQNDVGALRLVSPPANVDSGTVIAPQAWVMNYGVNSATFDAFYRIGGFYSSTRNINSLGPGESTLVSFDNWNVEQRGTHVTLCSTYYAADEDLSNDTLFGAVAVWVRDAEAMRITAPLGVYDSGVVVAPEAWVRNLGSAPVSFPTTFRIGSFYSSIRNVMSLNPGDSTLLTFANWTVTQRGTHATRCTTALAGDQHPENNLKADSVTVRLIDVGLLQIRVPTDTVDSGATVVPRVMVKNYGTATSSFPVWFRIDDGTDPYSSQRSALSIQRSEVSAQHSELRIPLSAIVYEDSVWVDLAPGESVMVGTFDPWVAEPTGSYRADAFTELTGDLNPANDSLSQWFFVRPPQRDVGAVAIVVPSGTHYLGNVVEPAGTWRNYGTVRADFEAWMMIDNPVAGRIYTEKVDVAGLEPGDEIRVSGFRPCTLSVTGIWFARCSTYYASDGNPDNDVRFSPFNVITVWHEQDPMPLLPSGVPVRSGGWLAHNEATDFIYAAKGNGVPDFYAYSPGGGYWLTLGLIPAGLEGRPPKRGSKAVADGDRYVYMTKGNSTLGFWRYDILADSWEQLKDVPEGPSRKRVKGGTDLAYLDLGGEGYVYTLKGYRNEFYRYIPSLDSWETRADAPRGRRVSWSEGSWIEYDRDNLIYAHKAKYHEFWVYDVTADSWSSDPLEGMPFYGMMGRKRTSKDGGSSTWLDGDIYALKGGNTQEFWHYDPESKLWTEYDTMPAVGTTGRRKRVKGGADIVAAGPVLYALKGNSTLEFWSYRPSGFCSTPQAGHAGVEAAGALPGEAFALCVAPNPATDHVFVRYPESGAAFRSQARPIRVAVYDVAGRAVIRRAATAGAEATGVRIDLSRLASGVYLVQLQVGDMIVARKLVIQE